ncbi:MAG: hypothetical protein ABIN08_12430 [Caldimonas sp.]
MSRHRYGVAEWLLGFCGVWQVGLGIYFVVLRPALLPEDLRYMGADLVTLQAAAPALVDWLRKVFTVMGGFMAGAGVLTTYLAWKVLPLRPPGATAGLFIAGALTVGLMSVVNFALASDFRWLLALPPIAWAVALLLYDHGPEFR